MKLNKLLCSSLIALSIFVPSAFAQSDFYGVVKVEESSLKQDSFAIGGLSSFDMPLPSDAWASADGSALADLFLMLGRSSDSPAIENLRKSLLLGVAPAPSNVSKETELAKMKALYTAGFYKQAAAFAEFTNQIGTDPIVSEIAARAALLENDVASVCNYSVRLQSGRSQPFWLKLRYLCYLEANESAAADLTMGLLRERNLLTANEEKLFNALYANSQLDDYEAPTTPFEWFATLKLNNGVAPFAAEKLSGPYLAAYSRLGNLPLGARLEAREKAYFLGLISQKELTNTYDVIDFSVEDMSRAISAQTSSDSKMLATALAYRTVQQMQAIEFANDRALLIGTSLKAAPDLQTFIIRSHLFMQEIGQIEFLDGFTSFSADFALSGLVNRSYGVTQRWLSSSLTTANLDGTISPATGLERLIPVLQMWSLFEENAAVQTASYAGLTIVKPEVQRTDFSSLGEAKATSGLANLVKVRLSQAGQMPSGVQALMWLALSNHSTDNPELSAIKTYLEDDVSSSELVLKTESLAEFYRRLTNYLERPSNRLTIGQTRSNSGFAIVPRLKPAKDA